MNLQNVKNAVVAFFLKAPLLTRETFSKVQLGAEYEPYRDALITNALKDLSEIKFVRPLSPNGEIQPTAWILENEIGTSGQSIEISLDVAKLIYSHISNFRKANDIPNPTNLLSLTEDDVVYLCVIINALLENQTGRDGDEKNEEQDGN